MGVSAILVTTLAGALPLVSLVAAEVTEAEDAAAPAHTATAPALAAASPAVAAFGGGRPCLVDERLLAF